MYFRCKFECRVIDVGCEWRTFSKDISRATDPSRVGGTANPILNGCDLTTLIRGGRGDAAFVKRGNGIYAARYGLNIFERGILTGFTDISQMGSRLNLTDSTITRANELFKVNSKLYELSQVNHLSKFLLVFSRLSMKVNYSKDAHLKSLRLPVSTLPVV